MWATILHLIRGLAEYEHEPLAAEATEQDLLRDGFGCEPRFRCVIAEWGRRGRRLRPLFL